MTRAAHALAERIVVGLMLAGMAGMFQPFAVELYRYGFLLLLVSTIGFIIVSHLTPRPQVTDQSS